MTTIYERRLLECPYVRAREYLRESYEKAAERHDVLRLPLSVPMSPLPGAIQKNVLIWYERGDDPMHFDEPWNVKWTPEGGGPYPDFNGQMTVRADDSYRHAILELRGEYMPPLGAVGRGFDLLAGSKIASVTARRLLEQIGTEMEGRYRAEESAKCSKP